MLTSRFSCLALLLCFTLIFPSNSIAAPQAIGAGSTAVDANGELDGINFTADGIALVADGQEINSNSNLNGVTTNSVGTGTLTFLGSSVVRGKVSASYPARIGRVNVNGVGALVDFQSVATWNAIHFGADAEVRIADIATLGTISTSQNHTGTLTLLDFSSNRGDVGAQDYALKAMNFSFDHEFYGSNIYVDQITTWGDWKEVFFTPDSGTATIRANIQVRAGGDPDTDYICFNDNIDFAGNIGTAELPYGVIEMYSDNDATPSVKLSGNIFATYLFSFDNGRTLNFHNLNYTSTLNGDIEDNSDAADGLLRFTGTNSLYAGIAGFDVDFDNGTTTLDATNPVGSVPGFYSSNGNYNVKNGATAIFLGGGRMKSNLTVADGGAIDIKDKTLTLDAVLAKTSTLASGSSLKLKINNAASYGKLVVINNHTLSVLAGSKVNLDLSAATISAGETFRVVDAVNDGVSGIAAPTVEEDSLDWTFDVTAQEQGDGSWWVTLTAQEPPDLGEVTTSGSAQSAGEALETVRDTAPTGDMANILLTLEDLPQEAVSNSLNSMLPDSSGVAIEGTTALSDNFVGTQMTHLGGNTQLASGTGETGISAGDQIGEWTTWLQAFGNYAHQDPRGTSQGYNLSNGGAVVGLEKVLTDRYRMGLAVGDAQSFVRSKDSSGRTDINATQLALYGGYLAENPLYINHALFYALNDFHATRQINVGPTDHRVADADFQGDLYGGMIEAGYGIKMGSAVFTPSTQLNYSHLHLPKYTEQGAGALNLDVAAQDYDRLRASVGGKLEMPQETAVGTFTPDVHAKYLYDIIAEKQQVLSSFTGGGTAFSTEGFKPARSGVAVGTGVRWATKQNLSLSLQYELELREDYYAHTGFVNVASKF